MEPIIQEMTMRDYLRVMFRQKAVVITTILTVLITVFIGLKLKTPMYEAQVKLLVSGEKQMAAPYYRDIIGARNVEIALTQSEIVKSDPVIERAVSALGMYDMPLEYEKKFCSFLKGLLVDLWVRDVNKKLAGLSDDQKKSLRFRIAMEYLRARLKVEPVRDTNLFTISVEDFSPVGAALIANVVSRSYVIYDLEQQLAEMQIRYGEKNLAVTQLKESIEKMTRSLTGQRLPNIEAIGPASVKIVEQASVPLKPAGLPKSFMLILALFLSVFLGVMMAFMFEYLDQTFKSPQDAERFLNIPCLGSIPAKARVEAYHDLSDQVYLMSKDRNLKTLLVAAALPKEGVTAVIANLGKYMANKSGHRVLVIDANLRGPAIHASLGIPNREGLVDVIEGRVSLEKAVVDLSEKLSVLTAGSTKLNPITILDSHRMPEILKSAKSKYDIVLVDCANMRQQKDASVLSSHTDGVVLVVNEGKTRRQVVKSAIAPLVEKKANLLGVILNNRTFAIPKAIYERV